MDGEGNKGAMTVEIARTKYINEAVALARLVVETETSPIGEIVGETGTGKTIAARAIVQALGATRICAHEGMSRYQLLGQIVPQIGIEGPSTRWLDMLAAWADGQRQRPLLVVDEANKLRWQALEVLRYLADECHFAVILIGTELYERQFASARTRPLLLQLGRRIGAKRVRTGKLDRAETYAHIIRPRHGDVAEKDVVTAFWQGCRKGVWGEGVELAESCARVMQANKVGALSAAVLDAALSWTANRREIGCDAG